MTANDLAEHMKSVSATIRRSMMVGLGTAAFCLVTLLNASSKVGGIKLPLVGVETEYSYFLFFGPLLTLAAYIYLHVFLEYWASLVAKLADGAPRPPYLFNMDSAPARLISAFLLYWLAPLVFLSFAFRAYHLISVDGVAYGIATAVNGALFFVSGVVLAWLGLRRRPVGERGSPRHFVNFVLFLGILVGVPSAGVVHRERLVTVYHAVFDWGVAPGKAEEKKTAEKNGSADAKDAEPGKSASVASSKKTKTGSAGAQVFTGQTDKMVHLNKWTQKGTTGSPFGMGGGISPDQVQPGEKTGEKESEAKAKAKEKAEAEALAFNTEESKWIDEAKRVVEAVTRSPGGRPALSYSNLENVDLSRSNLAAANLKEADFRYNHTLANARLIGAVLYGADLRDIRFRAADFTFADLTRADLDGSDLGQSRFWGAIWDRTSVEGADFGEVRGLNCAAFKTGTKDWMLARNVPCE